MDWPAAEAALTAPVDAWLHDQGFRTRREVWINGRVADLYGWRELDDATIAIELKLTAWKGAVAQAMTYQVGAQLAYVATPLDQAQRILERARIGLETRHVGLLAVTPPGTSPRVRPLLEATPSPRLLPFTEEKVRRKAKRTSPNAAVRW